MQDLSERLERRSAPNALPCPSPQLAAEECAGIRAEKLPFVSVVMPCLNEERTVGTCVRKALSAIAELGLPGEVIVSDNGSTDASVDVARGAGAEVVHCERRGYGSAIQFGATRARGDFIIMGDADDSYDFGEIGVFVAGLMNGADLVMGNRFQGGIRPGAMPWKNKYIGNPVLTGILNVLFRTGVGDAHCGLRAFTCAAF